MAVILGALCGEQLPPDTESPSGRDDTSAAGDYLARPASTEPDVMDRSHSLATFEHSPAPSVPAEMPGSGCAYSRLATINMIGVLASIDP